MGAIAHHRPWCLRKFRWDRAQRDLKLPPPPDQGASRQTQASIALALRGRYGSAGICATALLQPNPNTFLAPRRLGEPFVLIPFGTFRGSGARRGGVPVTRCTHPSTGGMRRQGEDLKARRQPTADSRQPIQIERGQKGQAHFNERTETTCVGIPGGP